ncbi:MFS transporter [Desulfacinum hydrothermale]|uniref:MFS transporter n=1 Tax=Desulfacinum hydrothermale TaxID=109258 RepID=UPI001482097A|nr:MFS transporter [Desulfacinum hydrothermale]
MFLGMRGRTWLLLIASRIVLNMSFRVAYPFLPAMARGLGISLEQAGLMMAARSLVGLSGIAFGIFAEKRGYKAGLLLGIAFLLVSCFLVTVSQNYWIVFTGFVVMGLATAVYNPSVQSYVSAHVGYRHRARALGLVESSWSASWFLGIPLSGLLIARWGWDSPYLLLLALAVFLFAATFRLPDAPAGGGPEPASSERSGTGSAAPNVPSRRIWLALAVTFCIFCGNENVMIVYGAWMESRFGLNVQSLGLFSTLLGLSEFCAEISVALLVDRLGKRRGLTLGIVGTAASYLLLTFVTDSLAAALASLMAMAYFFEFSVVSSFPYISQLAPSERGKWLAANYSLLVAGRVLGALVGPALWEHFGSFQPIAILSIVGNLAALGFLSRAPRPAGEPT